MTEDCCSSPVALAAESWNPQPRVVTLEQSGFLVLEDCGFIPLEKA